jgi:soluble lytic murein transglycosylase-like protein
MPNLTGKMGLGAVFFAFLIGSLAPLGETRADIYAYKDPQGVLHFTNTPTSSRYRPIIIERGKGSASSLIAPAVFEELIRSAANRYGVDAHLVQAVIKVESDFNSQARSHKGAQGLMQLMPETAQLHQVSNVYNPQENIDGGVRHLKLLLDRYQGDLQLTLAAYNAGMKAVEKHGGVPPFAETREYIRRVLTYLDRYRGSGTISIKEEASR